MNFKTSIKGNKVILTSNLPEDNYKKYTDKFLGEFQSKVSIDPVILGSIIETLQDAKSWRLFNRELRKACNIYTHDNKIMDVATFQETWFYEGTMYMRTTYGATAPWKDGSATKQIPASTKSAPKVQKTVEAIPVGDEETGRVASTGKAHVWNIENSWDKINKAIADRLND